MVVNVIFLGARFCVPYAHIRLMSTSICDLAGIFCPSAENSAVFSKLVHVLSNESTFYQDIEDMRWSSWQEVFFRLAGKTIQAGEGDVAGDKQSCGISLLLTK